MACRTTSVTTRKGGAPLGAAAAAGWRAGAVRVCMRGCEGATGWGSCGPRVPGAGAGAGFGGAGAGEGTGAGAGEMEPPRPSSLCFTS